MKLMYRNQNLHLSILILFTDSNVTKSTVINFNLIQVFVTICGKMWQLQSLNCQNWNLHTT